MEQEIIIENNSEHEVIKNQNIQLDIVTEGKATVRLSNDDKSFSAFYNPAQEFNRDLSVVAINTFFKFNKFRKEKEIKLINENKFSICECLSATGLRAIRYFKELDEDLIKEIVANDMDKKAVDCIYNNVEMNNVNKDKFTVCQSEASQLLYSQMKKFDVIDLDPYGSAIPMIDAAIQSVKNGGLLCVTFTDMPVLCGNYPETAFYKYGSIPYKTSFCHEMAKRMAMFSISSTASKYKKVVKPLLSFNAEFYIRLFLIVKDSPEDCKNNALKYGYVYHCRNCQNRIITPLANELSVKNNKNGKSLRSIKFNNLIGTPLCEVCDSNMCMNGPYWIDNLHDDDFINDLVKNLESENCQYLKYNKRILNFLNGILEELPLYKEVFNYDYAQFCRDIQLSCPKFNLIKYIFISNLFRGALESLGFKIVQSYYDPNLFKTNAPAPVLYDIFKKYKKDNYASDYLNHVKEDSYRFRILGKDIKVDPIFVESTIVNEKKTKYMPNPFPNWGPKSKAKEIK